MKNQIIIIIIIRSALVFGFGFGFTRVSAFAPIATNLHNKFQSISASPTGINTSIGIDNDTSKRIIAPKVSTISLKFAATNSDLDSSTAASPQAIGTGYSQNPDILFALEEATKAALASLPPDANIDLGIVYISSLYDGQCSPTKIVPAIIASVDGTHRSLQKLIGCSAGGLVGSKHSSSQSSSSSSSSPSISTVESEGEAGVTISLCVLPDTQIQTFHSLEDDIPDELVISSLTPEAWKQSVGMSHLKTGSDSADNDHDVSFMLLPSPSFQNELDDFLKGMKMVFGPASTIFGAISSTVSSLSRAKLFRYDVDEPDSVQALTEGCIGVAMTGDVEFKVMLAQGSKPVGGIYRVVSGEESTIRSIQLDEVATEQLQAVEEGDGDDEFEDEVNSNEEENDAKKRMAAAYKKAVIPKPVLAEANYLMKTLSDDDQAYMSKFLLVGLERSGGIGKSPSEILRLAEGLGHRFTVHQVASAGMKDGSVTLPLGSVDMELGTRMRFFVKDGEFAKKEVEAIWTGYKKKELRGTFSDDKKAFNPSGCFVFPTLDRGQALFGGKAGFESSAIAQYIPSVPAIGGFFSNGVIAAMDENDDQVMVHGSASCYALVGSKSGRPIYSASKITVEKEEADQKAKDEERAELAAAAENELNTAKDLSADSDEDKPAPRSEDGELITKRREIHSGRALTVSTVQWSVADNMAKPSSALEGFMWDKETEVDRFRERVPLSNLLSQCRLYDLDPAKPRPRDWIGTVKTAAEKGFVIIPELKRTEPISGSLRKRYDVNKLTKQFVGGGALALSVNCDKVLFGGVLEDITESRAATFEAISSVLDAEEGMPVAPPILASDLILYPYQLYKLRLAGADAINLVVGALTSKDILYLSKIAASLKFSVIASVTSEVQIRNLLKLSGGIDAISLSNRDLETFAFDNTGAQALDLLKSDAMKEYREKNPDTVVLAEGRVGMIEMEDGTGGKAAHLYVQALKDAGAVGAIVGGGLADIKDNVDKYLKSLAS